MKQYTSIALTCLIGVCASCAKSAGPSITKVSTADSSTIYANVTGTVSTLAGNGQMGLVNGPGSDAEFDDPIAVAVGNDGNVYVLDNGNMLVRKITPDGVVSTYAGDGTSGYRDGPASQAEFQDFHGIAVDAYNNVYVSEGLGGLDDNRIRAIDPSGNVRTVAGNGVSGVTTTAVQPWLAMFNGPNGLSVQPSSSGGVIVYVADEYNDRIQLLYLDETDTGGLVIPLAGNGTQGFKDGLLDTAEFFYPCALTTNGRYIFIADFYNYRIRYFQPTGGVMVATMAGTGVEGVQDGPGDSATFEPPNGIAVDTQYNVYVTSSDFTNNDNRIRMIPAIPGFVHTLAGALEPGYVDGPLKSARFKAPYGIASDLKGNLYVVDEGNLRIRKITLH